MELEQPAPRHPTAGSAARAPGAGRGRSQEGSGLSEASIRVAAILLLAVPTVEIGGASLLAMIAGRIPGYLDNPVRRHLFRAGHAHAGGGLTILGGVALAVATVTLGIGLLIT